MSQKIITIFGATGNQGGSVAAAILGHPDLTKKYKVRAVTRNPKGEAAQKLASQGCELAEADTDKKESVAKAVAGSYGVFGVTNYWDSMDKATEIRQGKAIVDACKQEGVKHLVWSTLPHPTKLTNGELSKIEHFESKAEVAEYADSIKGNDMITSFVMPAYFMSNFTESVKLGDDKKTPTMKQPWHPTKTQLALIDIKVDTGKFAMGLFEAGSDANGVKVQAVSEWTTPKQVTDTISDATGIKVEFEQIDLEADTIKGDKAYEELMENMLLIRDYSYYGKGTEKNQAESDKYFLSSDKKATWAEFAKKVDWKW